MSFVSFIGIDVSKDSFEAACHGRPPRGQYPNNPRGFAAFARDFTAELRDALVVLEATGGYEDRLAAFLGGRGIALHKAAPLAARRFSQSLGQRGKTDRMDAQTLARYGAERGAGLRLHHRDPQGEDLARLIAWRDDLVGIRVGLANRAGHPRYAGRKASLARVLAALDAEIDALQAEIAEAVAAQPEMAKKAELLRQIKGVGELTAALLVAALPELGSLTRRQVASLVGCAPHPRDSGKSSGYRATGGGRAKVKRALFLATMAARRYNPNIKAFYERLVANGKKKMVALVAAMRKLIVILNAILRDAYAGQPSTR